jgi:GTPase
MKFGTMAIVGCPNVGKSTLVNTLVNQKVAIVSNKPQTTRSRILGVAHFPEGQLALLDTPGLHRPLHRLNKRMVRAALDTLDEADVVAVMVDGRKMPGAGDRAVIEQVFSMNNREARLPVFLLVNKIDVISKPKVLPVMDAYQSLGEWTEIIPLSAKTGMNLDRLRTLVFERFPDDQGGAYDEDFVTDQSLRRLAAETVREKVLEQTKAELPYAVAVLIDEFVEKGKLYSISASIMVERSGQKAIIIGKGGSRLKEIGTAARLDLEREMGVKVFLDLHVKVKENWRDNESLLIDLGY